MTISQPFDPWVPEVSRVLYQKVTSGLALRVALYLCDRRTYSDATARVSHARIADVLGASTEGVRKALNTLRDAGVISWETRHRKATVYNLLFVHPTVGRPASAETPAEALDPTPVGQLDPTPVGSIPNGDTQIKEVGSTGSNPPPAREIDEPEKNTHADDLIEDPRREVRRRTVVNDRRLVEEGAEEIAGRADPVAALGLVRADVRLRRLARDSVADVIDEYLAPAEGLDVIYSAERAVPYLGDRGRPFVDESAVPPRFRAMLGATDDTDSDTYARSVWQRVRRAAVWEELTPRVVEAAVRELGEAPALIAESAALGVSGPSSAADAMVLEIWTQVKAQRMSIRSVCDATDRVIA